MGAVLPMRLNLISFILLDFKQHLNNVLLMHSILFFCGQSGLACMPASTWSFWCCFFLVNGFGFVGKSSFCSSKTTTDSTTAKTAPDCLLVQIQSFNPILRFLWGYIQSPLKLLESQGQFMCTYLLDTKCFQCLASTNEVQNFRVYFMVFIPR